MVIQSTKVPGRPSGNYLYLEMFYLNTIEQVFLLVEQLNQLVVCITYSRLLTGIPIMAVFQNLRWNSNKTSLLLKAMYVCMYEYKFLVICFSLAM